MMVVRAGSPGHPAQPSKAGVSRDLVRGYTPRNTSSSGEHISGPFTTNSASTSSSRSRGIGNLLSPRVRQPESGDRSRHCLRQAVAPLTHVPLHNSTIHVLPIGRIRRIQVSFERNEQRAHVHTITSARAPSHAAKSTAPLATPGTPGQKGRIGKYGDRKSATTSGPFRAYKRATAPR